MKHLAVLLIALAATGGWCAENIAIVKNVKGDVTVKENEGYKALEKGEFLHTGDVVKTGEDGRTGLGFNDGTVVSLGPKSVFVVNQYAFKPAEKVYAFDVTLNKGSAAVETGKMSKLAPQNVAFKVPQGSVGVRGTKFIVEVQE